MMKSLANVLANDSVAPNVPDWLMGVDGAMCMSANDWPSSSSLLDVFNLDETRRDSIGKFEQRPIDLQIRLDERTFVIAKAAVFFRESDHGGIVDVERNLKRSVRATTIDRQRETTCSPSKECIVRSLDNERRSCARTATRAKVCE
jgi:hypothetical protein